MEPQPAEAALGRARRAVSGQFRSLARPLAVHDYLWLWLAQVTSELGDWATRLALSLVVYHRTHSAALSAAVVTVSLVPWAGLGQMVTAKVDHLPRKTVMVAADMVRVAVFGILVLPLPVPAFFVGAFLGGLASAPFEGARYSIRVEVTDDDEVYGGAITLFGITTQVTTILGFALGGVLVALVGTRVAFAANAGSFLISAVCVTRVRTNSSGRSRGSPSKRWLRSAVSVVLRDPVLRWCSVLSLSTSFAAMAIAAIATPYGGGHPGRVALLAMAVPIGEILSGVVAPHSGPPGRLLRAAGFLPMIGGAFGVLMFSAGNSLTLAVIGFAASGVAASVTIPAGPIVGRRLDSAHRAPVFSILQGAALGGQALGAAVGGLLAGAFGPRATCIAACAALFLLGAAASVNVPDPSLRFDPAK